MAGSRSSLGEAQEEYGLGFRGVFPPMGRKAASLRGPSKVPKGKSPQSLADYPCLALNLKSKLKPETQNLNPKLRVDLGTGSWQ